jgi:hypothetical protein
MEHKINNAIKKMLEFQKINNVTQCWMTNSQIAYDILKPFKKAKVKAFFLMTPEFMRPHLALLFDSDTIIEPSYDVTILKDREYLTLENVNFSETDPVKVKELKDMYDQFEGYARDMNNNKFLINNKKVYYDQWDYIRKDFDGLLTAIPAA